MNRTRAICTPGAKAQVGRRILDSAETMRADLFATEGLERLGNQEWMRVLPREMKEPTP